MSLEPIYKYIDDHLDESISRLAEYIRQPSVSVGDGSGMRECAALVADHYRRLGATEVQLVDTETYPGVWGYYDAGAPLTIVNYNMYDVRSVGDRSAWSHEPFEPTIDALGDFPAVMYGRGALVPKGPDIAWLSALEAIRAVTGTLPVNIMFLAEGDEILGSQSYAGLIDRFRQRLAGIDGLVYLRGTQNRAGEITMTLGYKTIITFELTASGASWGRGPTEHAAHSATRPIVDSPALRLVQALGTLYDASGELHIPGWASMLAPAEVPVEDRPLFDKLLEKYIGQRWQDVIPGLPGAGVEVFADDLEGPAVLARYMFGSHLNIMGIYGGYTGPGKPTYTVPDKATARLDARLVARAHPEELMASLRTHLDEHGYSDVTIQILSAYPGSRNQYFAPLVQSFIRALQRAGGSAVIWPMQGYGGPWSIFTRDFGVPMVFGTGVGHGGGAGLSDEYIVLDGGGQVPGFREIQRFCVDFLTDYASSGAKSSG
jgi:acetylornithine deacetylase/succinyl-diaminopimelate desuccinylase-like protein